MALFARTLSMLILVLLTLPVFFLKGCGDIDNEETCPGVVKLYASCENMANERDTISGPSSDSVSVSAAFAGSNIYYVPLVYILKDSAGTPRNHSCVNFWTDGVFFADKGYTTPMSTREILLRTNDRGVICIYWATNAVGAPGESGESFVKALVPNHEFTVSWTVQP